MRTKCIVTSVFALLFVIAAMSAPSGSAVTTDQKDSPKEKQRELVRLLNSDAAPSEKALACKQLAIYGTREAVPALEKLLADESLASWARIALEAIPGSAPDAALRRAMEKLHGRLLIGTINSIAVRKDRKAVGGLVRKLNDIDSQVGSAAAIALGQIGGVAAADALKHAVTDPPPGVSAAAAQGCLLCAEWFANHGRPADALSLYETVRTAALPKHLVLEATRLTILAKKSDGLPLLLEQLRSPDKATFGFGLRTARELAGTAVSDALVAELKQTSAERQSLLLLAVADRDDATAAAAVLEMAKSGDSKLRVIAIGALERQGHVDSVPVLIEAANAPDEAVALAGIGALTRLPGDEVNSIFVARLSTASGKTRQILIDVAARRRIEPALPVIIQSVGNSDPGVRAAAIQAIGTMGDQKQIPELVKLLQQNSETKQRTDLQTALIAICTRKGAGCVPDLLPLTREDDSGLRLIALPILAAAGGSDALAAVKAAVDDKDEAVRDDAVRTLSTWPNNWPEDAAVMEPLLSVAKSDKTSYQVLALRGYLHFVEGDKQLKDAEKVLKIKAVVPMIQRPEEQQLTMGIIGGIPNADALDLLVGFADTPATSQDACAAILKLTGNKRASLSKEQRQKALQTVVDKSKDDQDRQKAEQRLKDL